MQLIQNAEKRRNMSGDSVGGRAGFIPFPSVQDLARKRARDYASARKTALAFDHNQLTIADGMRIADWKEFYEQRNSMYSDSDYHGSINMTPESTMSLTEFLDVREKVKLLPRSAKQLKRIALEWNAILETPIREKDEFEAILRSMYNKQLDEPITEDNFNAVIEYIRKHRDKPPMLIDGKQVYFGIPEPTLHEPRVDGSGVDHAGAAAPTGPSNTRMHPSNSARLLAFTAYEASVNAQIARLRATRRATEAQNVRDQAAHSTRPQAPNPAGAASPVVMPQAAPPVVMPQAAPPALSGSHHRRNGILPVARATRHSPQDSDNLRLANQDGLFECSRRPYTRSMNRP